MAWEDHPELVHGPGDGYDPRTEEYDMGDMADDKFEERRRQLDFTMRAAGMIPPGRYNIGNAAHRAIEDYYIGSVWDVEKNSKLKRAEQLEKQAKELREKVESEETRRDAFGPEPDLGSVLLFEKVWPVRKAPFRSVRNEQLPVRYLYSAVRTKIGWTVSARESMDAMSWDELIEFIGDSECKIAKKWKTIQ